jgi:hypothetical protein
MKTTPTPDDYETKDRVRRYVTLQDGSVHDADTLPVGDPRWGGVLVFNWPCARCGFRKGWNFLEPVGPRLCAVCRWETR